jgi:hypothetical protein
MHTVVVVVMVMGHEQKGPLLAETDTFYEPASAAERTQYVQLYKRFFDGYKKLTDEDQKTMLVCAVLCCALLRCCLSDLCFFLGVVL